MVYSWPHPTYKLKRNKNSIIIIIIGDKMPTKPMLNEIRTKKMRPQQGEVGPLGCETLPRKK